MREKRIAIDNLMKIEICNLKFFVRIEEEMKNRRNSFYFVIFDELNSKFFGRFKSHPTLGGEIDKV